MYVNFRVYISYARAWKIGNIFRGRMRNENLGENVKFSSCFSKSTEQNSLKFCYVVH